MFLDFDVRRALLRDRFRNVPAGQSVSVATAAGGPIP
jgi:hypothetical protein